MFLHSVPSRQTGAYMARCHPSIEQAYLLIHCKKRMVSLGHMNELLLKENNVIRKRQQIERNLGAELAL